MADTSASTIELFSENCCIYQERGFTVVNLAAEPSSHRICAIRKNDYRVDKKLTPRNTFVVEFYLASRRHLVYEWGFLVANTSAEVSQWVDSQNVFIACGDGSLLLSSPHSTVRRRFQICASPITGLSLLPTSQIAATSGSSELVIISIDQLCENVCNAKITPAKPIIFSKDDRIISIASSANEPIIALGMINGVCLIKLPYSIQSRINIQIPHSPKSETIVWSLAFIGDTLFSGDSRGIISLFNALNGAILKTIHTHEDAILVLATDGKKLYASGVDYRIHIIEGVKMEDNRQNWIQKSQRLIHLNDVRSMCCVGKLLISGGAEHEIIVSDAEQHISSPIVKSRCSFSINKGLILMRHIEFAELWYKPKNLSKINPESGVYYYEREIIPPASDFPRKIANIFMEGDKYVAHAAISPCGGFLCLVGELGEINILSVYTSNPKKAKRKKRGDIHVELEDYFSMKTNQQETITSIECSTNNLYIASESHILRRVNLKERRPVVIARKDDGVIKVIRVSRDDNLLSAITTSRILLYRIRITSNKNECTDQINVEVREIKLPFTAIDCAFTYDEKRLLFIGTKVEPQIIIYDLTTEHSIFSLSAKKLQLDDNEYLNYISPIIQDQIIFTTNKGRCKILSDVSSTRISVLDQKQNDMITNEHKDQVQFQHTFDSEDIEKNDSPDIPQNHNIHSEPFWFNEMTSKENSPIKRSFMLVVHEKFSEPTHRPIKIRRYGFN